MTPLLEGVLADITKEIDAGADMQRSDTQVRPYK